MDANDFETLPGRVFLDSCTLQTLREFGGFIWDGEPLDTGRLRSIPGGEANVRSLREVFLVGDRGSFQWILSDASIGEAAAKRDAGHLAWAFDVLDHSRTCLAETGAATVASRARASRLDSGIFGYLSAKDRVLIRDAVLLDCDAFLTMERRLPRNAKHLEREAGLRVLTPIEYWSLLRPWAALFR